MPLSLTCLPEGRFQLSGEAETAAERRIEEAFRAGGDAGGLIFLTSSEAAADINQEKPHDPGVDWLRRFGLRWLARVCQTRLPAPPLPAMEELSERVMELPLLTGSEYVSVYALERLWREAGAELLQRCGVIEVQTAAVAAANPKTALQSKRAAEPPDAGRDAALSEALEMWLRTHSGQWHLVGRVTFHLAENKHDLEHPFAFLATYTDAVNAAGKLQHIPLGRALQAYAEAEDRTALQTLLTPVRAAADRSPWVRELLETRRIFQALRWTPLEAYDFIKNMPVLEECGVVAKVPDWWQGGKPARPVVQVKLDTEKSLLGGVGAMLSFQVTTTLDGEPLTGEDLERIRSTAGSGLLNLRGRWVEIDPGKMEQVLSHWEKVAAAHEQGDLTFHEGMRFLAGFHGGAGAAQDEEGLGAVSEWSQVIAGKHLQEALKKLSDPAARPAPQGLLAVLRPYQEKGLGWLHFMRALGLGACLADDMGLGKTVQVIALLLTTPPKRGPVLLAVPASLLGNWRAEFLKFAPKLSVFYAHSSQTPRDELDAALAKPAKTFSKHDAVVTTYGLIQRTPSLQEMDWQAVILDEAQAIKNPATAQAKSIKKLRAPWRLALTGTPVENRPGDLWSLFDFLNPGLLGKPADFARTMKALSESKHGYAPLRKLAQPYILRRLKTDRSVISDLPDKTEITAHCGLSRKQAVIYARLVEQLKLDLNDPNIEPMQRRGVVVGYLAKFKQVCNHISHWSGDGVYAPDDSGKFRRLREICQELAERQERVLIFTQFREIMDPLAAFLTGIFRRPGLLLHGGTPVKQRQRLVEQFQAPGGPPFFLLSVKAGGTGLTLTAASHVIHFDRWWNPAVENQATDRAYRIGQKRNVLVHKFVCPGTLEERIDAMIESKKALAADLLGTDEVAETALTEMSSEELLRFVALDVNAAVTG